MAAKITSIIPPDNFELLRDATGALLLLELGNQKVLDPTFAAPDKVWIERFVPYNTQTENPYMNVRFKKGDPDERSRERTQTKYTHAFAVDISVKSKSTNTTAGDQLASIALHKLLRMVRSILSNPLYEKMGTDLPVGRRYITALEVYEPMEMQDSTNQVDGCVEFCVEVPEYSANPVTGTICNWITTTVQLNDDGTLGHFWEFKQKDITLVATGAALVNAFFTTPITEIVIEGTTYTAGTDFAQDILTTTITATTFTFTTGKVITAKT